MILLIALILWSLGMSAWFIKLYDIELVCIFVCYIKRNLEQKCYHLYVHFISATDKCNPSPCGIGNTCTRNPSVAQGYFCTCKSGDTGFSCPNCENTFLNDSF